MRDVHPRRRLLLALALTLTLLGSLVSVTAAQAKTGACGRASGCSKFELLHAGSKYKWYPEAARYEFKSSAGATPPGSWSLTGTPATWVAGSPGHGTLTTATGGGGGDVITDWNQAWGSGRWEVRFRSIAKHEFGYPAESPYEVKVELVPGATRGQRCAPESITLADYTMGVDSAARLGTTHAGLSSGTARGTTGPLYDTGSWRNGQSLTTSAWHTFAVEVAADHISWFFDAKVVATEKRSALLFSSPLHLRISLLTTPGSTATVPAVTQLDWARHWSLTKTKKKTVRVVVHGKKKKKKKKVQVYKGIKRAKILRAAAPTLGGAPHADCTATTAPTTATQPTDTAPNAIDSTRAAAPAD